MYGNLSHFFNIFQIIFIFIIIIHFLDRVAVREFILLSSVTGCPSVCLVWVLSHHRHRHRQHCQPLSPILQRLTKFFFLFPRQGDERETQREKKRNHNNNNTHLIAKTGDNFKQQKQNHFVNIKQSFYLYSHLVFPFNLGQFLDSKKKTIERSKIYLDCTLHSFH